MSAQKAKQKVVKQNVGVDISKDDFKVCFYQRDSNDRQFIKGTRTFKNTLTGFKEFYKWVNKKRSSEIGLHFTIEATGVYYENLVHFLVAQTDYHISVVLPNQSKAYAKSLNLKTKTDKVDAKMLGQMGLERALKKWEPISDKMLLLKQLTRERVNLIDEKTALSNKLHALQHAFNSSKDVIKRLKQRLELIKKQLSYAGYDVVQRESGSSIKGRTRISKKGNRFIRRALYFPAITLVKYEDRFKQLFDRVLSRSFIKMKAYVAVQRKALILIYTLFKKDQEYNPNFLNEQNLQHENEKLAA